ncbi:MAG: glycosyltransferase, partial [Bacteroides sp.]
MNLLTLNTLELILLVTFVALFIVQIGYHWGLYSRIYFRYRAVNNNKLKFETDFPPLSVVICAKNESENLKRYLPSILEQDYPQFEVIVVNDGSTDESDDILSRLEEEYPHLYHTFTPETARYISRKKLSLTIGIKASKYDWLVFTEANCRPSSPDWLKLMARNFTSSTDVVLGYSGYESAKGWLQQ